jgi:hypothetical protein
MALIKGKYSLNKKFWHHYIFKGYTLVEKARDPGYTGSRIIPDFIQYRNCSHTLYPSFLENILRDSVKVIERLVPKRYAGLKKEYSYGINPQWL